MMKNHIISAIVFVVFVACTGTVRNSNTDKKQQLDTLYESNETIVLGSLENGLFNDSMEVYRNGELLLTQVWKKGILEGNEYNDKGIKRKLVYVQQRIDSNTTESHYTDKADSNFKIIPYYDDLMSLYNNYKKLSAYRFKANESTEFLIYNVPKELIKIGVTGAIIRRENNAYVLHPERLAGDTIRMIFFGLNSEETSEPLSFELQ